MAFEVVDGDNGIRVNNRTSDLCRLDVLSFYRDLHVVGSLQTVGYDHLTACGEWAVSVRIGGVHMLQSMFSLPYIQCVAVREERHPALLPDLVRDNLGVVGSEVCKVPIFAEMDLQSHELLLEVHVLNSGCDDQPVEFVE